MIEQFFDLSTCKTRIDEFFVRNAVCVKGFEEKAIFRILEHWLTLPLGQLDEPDFSEYTRQKISEVILFLPQFINFQN